MYQYSYGEIVADSPVGARSQERQAFDHAIGLLRAAAQGGAPEVLRQDAVTFTSQMWGLFIKDLAHSQNDLDDALRARLMSIGLWVLGELQRIEAGESLAFESVADICGLIRDGLN